jgi:hypothetical protein
MKDVGTNTLTAFQNARQDGLIMRDLVWIKAKNRSTGVIEEIGLWAGKVPTVVPVIDPETGASTGSARTYQPLGQLVVPSIPAGMALEVRTIRLKISRLSPAVLDAIRLYDARMAVIEIHRGIFDLDTGQIVDPAMCRFSGYINAAPINVPKEEKGGKVGEGGIELECVSRSRILTRTSGLLFSMEMLKKRAGDLFGTYLDVAGAWRIWWGQDEKAIKDNTNERPKEHFFK